MRLMSIQRVLPGLLLALALGTVASCSRSAEDAERRGLVEEPTEKPEVAVPESTRELGETEAERRAQAEAELERAEQKRFDEAEEKARDPVASPGP